MDILHLKKTLALVLSLMIGTVFLHELHFTPWPAFLAVIFYFLSDFDNSKIGSIMLSGVVGVMFGYMFSFALPALIDAFGPSLGYYLLIAVCLFIVIGLGPVAHAAFNPMTFAYGLLALLYVDIARSESLTWLMTHLIGGGFIIACLYVTVHKMLPRLVAEKA